MSGLSMSAATPALPLLHGVVLLSAGTTPACVQSDSGTTSGATGSVSLIVMYADSGDTHAEVR